MRQVRAGGGEAVKYTTFDSLPSRPYDDWFGSGDTRDDVQRVVEQHGPPLEILLQGDGFMACIIYPDKVFVVGYDGNEYCHAFVFSRQEPAHE
jgi:hypothetical protein